MIPSDRRTSPRTRVSPRALLFGACLVLVALTSGACSPSEAGNHPCGGQGSVAGEPGQGCGPCGLDTLVCSDDGELICDGETRCEIGEFCESDNECGDFTCTAGRCAPENMSFIPAGAFEMGAPAAERGRIDGETLHDVALTRHFLIDTTEVTQAEWQALMGYNPSFFTWCGDPCPVENITWLDALAFANARSRDEGLETCYDLSSCTGQPGNRFSCEFDSLIIDLDCTGYRLPTEAEWEYAYRAGTTSAYYTGEPTSGLSCEQPVLDDTARYCGNCLVDQSPSYDCSSDGDRPQMPAACGPAPVASLQPNPWGLFDMAGNVNELVWDARGPYPEFAVDPTGPPPNGQVGIRGSNFCGHMARLRAADRKFTTPTRPAPVTGLRLVRTVRKADEDEFSLDSFRNNGCGGLEPISPAPGSPCGPCGLDTYVCDGTDSVTCSGSTDCNIGERCESDADCEGFVCNAGRCAPEDLAFVPAGGFTMGSPPNELGRIDGEALHPVALSRHLLMQTTEVSQAKWRELMDYNPSFFSDCGENCPVESVTWLETLAFANALSRSQNLPPCYDLSQCERTPGDRFDCPTESIEIDLDCKGYRLPTEAEWEYAYRATTSTAYYNGDPTDRLACEQPLLDAIANYCGNCSVDYSQTFDCSDDGQRPHLPTDCGTRPVASFEPNPWGLFDMSGNVDEFVWDGPDSYPAWAVDPTGPEPSGSVGVRGSNFCGHQARLRAADRKFTSWNRSFPFSGFRLVRTWRKATEEEFDVDTFCNNGCGGCMPLNQPPGTPCGPCGVDRFVCEGENATVCNGSTTCNPGQVCSSDSECASSNCSNGHCAPPGFTYVPEGEFMMGSPAGEPAREASEAQHPVTISRPFLIQSTEVSQAEWRRLFGNNPSTFRLCGDNCPVESVTWLDALAYANALSESQGLPTCYDLSGCTGAPGDRLSCSLQTGSYDPDCRGWRLPTEAEWEYAYRAGTSSMYYTGQSDTNALCEQPLLDDTANYCGNCEVEYEGAYDCSDDGARPHMLTNCGPKPVGQRTPNPWGIFDMAGNVAELVWDGFGPYPEQATDPTGAAHDGTAAVVRGAGFCGHMARLRAADRGNTRWITSAIDMGFRVVRTLD
ncbi:SUMF1/EgtB/PvdOfamily nonheme iron enzyme [Lujinxingia vulgaris]|uniref:SUMF1/EgtB/PvdOfamily nonheme iron enzyme n=1 Tax=Lujinxingia vulgaris TaxID=2600176 RepID=A0A5C6XRS5_9DELT|nr:SUMF1/EgtB/PvdO family nonheme iron enzyme [Lujinxingia vulgaris]TXD41662.1 SUMF1/EgtB/PvdOfamily nonheme iron enzyme [Lujinxingia vulgaris]